MSPVPRRRFLLATGGLLAAPFTRAQQPRRIYRIAYLSASPRPTFSSVYDAFIQGLSDLGYVEGKNLVIEHRSAEGKPERLPQLAADLVHAKVEVIVTGTNIVTRAAWQATKSTPIVMTVGTDVIGEGFAASLAKPGGNVTGVTWDVGVEVMAKRFEFLREAMPRLSRIAVLWDPGQDAPAFKGAIEQGGKAIGATLIWPEVTDELEPAFETAVREGAEALFTGGGPRLYRLRKKVVELAARHRLPDTHYDSAFVEAGGLMSYAPNLAGMFRRAAVYVDKILKGAKPGDLPIEQPTRLDLVINLRTAKALGLTIPPSLLIRADKVID